MKMNNAFKTLNLTTKNALDVVTAWLSASPSAVVFLTDNPVLPDPLLQRIMLTPGLHAVQSKYCGNEALSLVIAQPPERDSTVVEHLLLSPILHQVIQLHPTWFGRAILPEWHLATHIRTPKPARITNALAKQGNWRHDVCHIGNLRSLLWGFFSGRMLALNRLDLMDRCTASMRQHLFPDARPAALTYLRVLRWVKENPNL